MGTRTVGSDGLGVEIARTARLPAEQWIDGEFVFDAWLSDSLLVGTVERLDY
jgi:hypothetical protein